MKSELCYNCGRETHYPEDYDGLIPCVYCLKEIFPCAECESWHDSNNDACDFDDNTERCHRFIHRHWRNVSVSIGGKLKDHWVICRYVVDHNKDIEIKESWLVLGNYIRKIELRDFYLQVAIDGISGYLAPSERGFAKTKDSSGICPKCGSGNVNFGDVEFQERSNYQNCDCNDCDCRWTEIYEFKKKEIIEER